MNEQCRQGRSGDGLYKKRRIWYFRVIDWTGKRRAISSKTPVYSEARKIKTQTEDDLQKGVNPFGAGKETFAVAAERWMQRKSLDAAAETIRARTTRIRNINAVLGVLPLGQFNAQVLRQYQILRREKLAPASVNAETKIIVSILKENHLWLRIADDYKPLREPKTCGRKLTADELERLMRVSQERKDVSIIFLVLRFLLETGLRHKEIRMLRVGNVDLRTSEIHVPRDGTKTDAGERVIPLTTMGARIVADLLERAHALGATQPNHYLFPGVRFTDGRRVADPTKPQESFRDSWQTLRRLAGVDGRLRLHDIRHHVASDMAEAGVPGAVAMRLMGWVTAEMLKRYEHVQDDALRRAMDRLEIAREIQRTPVAPKPPRGQVIAFPVRSADAAS